MIWRLKVLAISKERRLRPEAMTAMERGLGDAREPQWCREALQIGTANVNAIDSAARKGLSFAERKDSYQDRNQDRNFH